MRTTIAAALALVASIATAGEYNQALNYGDPAPVWKNLPGVDGKKHSLDDLKDKKIVVVVFTCNSCPIAVDYEDRIIAFANKRKDDVAVVAINVNQIQEDSLPEMKKKAEEKKFPFVYLYDESQKIAKAYGATFTPEFFVLGPDRKIVYMGGMDDNSVPRLVKEQYLEPAVLAALNGTKPATVETVARGCRVRYARERRKPAEK